MNRPLLALVLASLAAYGCAPSSPRSQSADETSAHACRTEAVPGIASTIVPDTQAPGHYFILQDVWSVTRIEANEPFLESNQLSAGAASALQASPYYNTYLVNFDLERRAADSNDAITAALQAAHADETITVDPLPMTPDGDLHVDLALPDPSGLLHLDTSTDDGLHYHLQASLTAAAQDALLSFTSKRVGILDVDSAYDAACTGGDETSTIHVSASGASLSYDAPGINLIPTYGITWGIATAASEIDVMNQYPVNGSGDALAQADYPTYQSDQDGTLYPLLAWGNDSVTIDDVHAGVTQALDRHRAFVQTLLAQAGSTLDADAFLDAYDATTSSTGFKTISAPSPALAVLVGSLSVIRQDLRLLLQQDGSDTLRSF